MKLLHGIYRFFAGYAFAILLLGFLFLLTALGTLAQRDQSLFEVQKKYFESTFLIWELGPVSVPLPGVKLLLGLLCVNLILGGLVRIRKTGATAGVIVAHVGILWMLVAGLVEYVASTKGYMKLYPEQSTDEYISFFEWEITIHEDGLTREYVIPGEKFIQLAGDQRATFRHADLPFELAIERVHKNSTVIPVGRGRPEDPPPVGGYILRPLQMNKEAEADVAGCVAIIRDVQGGDESRVILWGLQQVPYTLERAEKRYAIDLHRRRWQVPFRIELAEFRKIDHPGTRMAASYESDVVKVESGNTEPITISMNNPLRHAGYTLFQSSWGPQDKEPGTVPLYSVFSVVRNPADAWPMYSCYVIAVGLLLHFLRKLSIFVRNQSRIRA